MFYFLNNYYDYIVAHKQRVEMEGGKESDNDPSGALITLGMNID